MAKQLRFFFPSFFVIFLLHNVISQDTFSIVAVDPETGEVGSAGASCVDNAAQFGGVILISGIIPGRGAINGQATVCIPHVNLNNGITQMGNGASPQEVLDYLFANDACQFGNENDRQYGVVDFDENDMPRAAAFTGSNTLNYAGHRVGANYSIQGNILLGPQILDSMEARFLSTEGPLAVKLMSAMQGANVPGADSRCLDEGTSSKSAFLRVARPDDELSELYLEINIAEEPNGVEPINSLQAAFDVWADTALVHSNITEREFTATVFPNPASYDFDIQWLSKSTKGNLAKFYLSTGMLLHQAPIYNGINSIHLPVGMVDQMVFLKIADIDGAILYTDKILMFGK